MGLEDLFGVWELISLQFVVTDSGECRDMYGAEPLGYIFITPDKRMITLITSKDRAASDSESGDAAHLVILPLSPCTVAIWLPDDLATKRAPERGQ